MPSRRAFNPAPASVDEDPRLTETNKKFDALINTLLRGEPFDWNELEAVRKKRLQLLAAAGRRDVAAAK